MEAKTIFIESSNEFSESEKSTLNTFDNDNLTHDSSTNNYPEHYPPILQKKLIEASRLTQAKRRLVK